MPVKELDQELRVRKARRILIVGPPNSGKTSSARTFVRPIGHFSYPGEEGVSSINLGEGIVARTFESGPQDSPRQIWNDVWQSTVDFIAGKYGPIKTFFGDGLFQLSTLALDVVSDGQLSRGVGDHVGEKVDPFLYPVATDMVMAYLRMVMDSKVEYAVFTCWDGKEVASNAANANVKSAVARATYPDLRGQLAKRAMGFFSVVLYAEMGLAPAPNQVAPAWWRLKATADMAAAGVKLPIEAVTKLPERVPQDWSKLEPILLAALTGQPIKPTK